MRTYGRAQDRPRIVERTERPQSPRCKNTGIDCFYDSPPLKPAMVFNERFMAARHKDGHN